VKLRARLLLALVFTAVPLALGVVWVERGLQREAQADALAAYAVERLENGGRENCERDPFAYQEPPVPFPPRPPRTDLQPPRPDPQPPRPRMAVLPVGGVRMELYAYRSNFISDNPRAPYFPLELRRALTEGGTRAHKDFEAEESHGQLVALRTQWPEGPLAFVLARRVVGGPRTNDHSPYGMALLLSGLMSVLVLLALGPLVKRLRSLRSAVEGSAASGYAQGVLSQGVDEIGELAQAFNRAGEQVRARIRELELREQCLRGFVENTTHDVMLPLTVLQGHISELEKTDPVRARAMIEEAHYMGSLIHNLGTVAKLETGTVGLVRHRLSLSQLVERAVTRQQRIARSKGIELVHAVPESPVEIEADGTLIEQALSNVIQNAVRYNHSGGHVAVVLEEAPGRFALRVLDDGPGVAPEELARLTERSYRSEAARERHPTGLGLGLAIAKDVLDRHGYELSLSPGAQGGLEVCFAGAVAEPG
jgi:signal transduction histidine kinase